MQLQSSHLSFQEYFAARAICEGAQLSGVLPWQWPAWWANMVKIGIEMGDSFGKGLLLASGVNGDSLDLAQKLGGNRPTVLSVLTAVMKFLTSVDLSFNTLGAEGAKPIAEAMSVSKSLTSINLNHNNLGPQGGKAIAEAISVSKSLTKLILFNNKLGAEGGKAIAEAISVSKSLTSVNLGGNSLGLDGGKAIAEAISVSKSLTSINEPLRGLPTAHNGAANTADVALDCGNGGANDNGHDAKHGYWRGGCGQCEERGGAVGKHVHQH